MSRLQKILWLLLAIVGIGIVAVATRTPDRPANTPAVRADTVRTGDTTARPDSARTDTAGPDSAETEVRPANRTSPAGASDQNSSQ